MFTFFDNPHGTSLLKANWLRITASSLYLFLTTIFLAITSQKKQQHKLPLAALLFSPDITFKPLIYLYVLINLLLTKATERMVFVRATKQGDMVAP